MFYGAEQPTVAQYLDLLCNAGPGVHLNSPVVPPAPWARQEGGKELQRLGDSDPGGGLGGKLYSWGPLAAASPS